MTGDRANKPCRVFIVDESRTTRAILVQALAAHAGFEIVGVARDGPSAVPMIRRLRPDLAIVDLAMPYVSGRQLLEALGDVRGLCKILIAPNAKPQMQITLNDLGADACIDKAEASRDPAAFCRLLASIVARAAAASRGGATAAAGRTDAAAAPLGYPVPADEFRRIRALDRWQLANDDEDHRLDLLTAHLTQTTSFSVSALMLIHRRSAWIKSAHGMARGQVDRAEAICSHTICADDVLILADARADARFRNLAAVRSGEVRAYAGCPIATPAGVRLGALCILDSRPRAISPVELTNLRNMACIAAEFVAPLAAVVPVHEVA